MLRTTPIATAINESITCSGSPGLGPCPAHPEPHRRAWHTGTDLATQGRAHGRSGVGLQERKKQSSLRAPSLAPWSQPPPSCAGTPCRTLPACNASLILPVTLAALLITRRLRWGALVNAAGVALRRWTLAPLKVERAILTATVGEPGSAERSTLGGARGVAQERVWVPRGAPGPQALSFRSLCYVFNAVTRSGDVPLDVPCLHGGMYTACGGLIQHWLSIACTAAQLRCTEHVAYMPLARLHPPAHEAPRMQHNSCGEHSKEKIACLNQ